MPFRRMPLNFRHPIFLPVDPPHELRHIRLLLSPQVVERPPKTLSLNPCLILRPHLVLPRQRRSPAKHCRHSQRLKLEKCECGCVERYADESECRVGDVEDVAVQIVHLGAVRDEDSFIRQRGGHGVVMVAAKEGERELVACADDDGVDVAEFVARAQSNNAWNWLAICEGTVEFTFGDVERGDLADSSGVLGEKVGREVIFAAAGGLVDVIGGRAKLTSDVGRGDACADKKDILGVASSYLQWSGKGEGSWVEDNIPGPCIRQASCTLWNVLLCPATALSTLGVQGYLELRVRGSDLKRPPRRQTPGIHINQLASGRRISVVPTHCLLSSRRLLLSNLSCLDKVEVWTCQIIPSFSTLSTRVL